MKIGRKLTVAIAGIGLLALGAFGIALVVQARSNILGSFYGKAMATSKEYAQRFGGYFASQWHVAQTAARVLEQYGSMAPAARRPFINRTLEGIVAGSPDVLGAWAVWEPNALDGPDSARLGAEGSDAAGRFAPYWHSAAGGRPELLVMDGASPEHIAGFYRRAMASPPGSISDPSFAYLSGRRVLLASIAATVSSAGRVVAVVGIDFSMDRIQETARGLYPLGDGITKVFSNNGTVVGHHLYPQNLGTSILDTERDMGGPYMDDLESAVRHGFELSYRHFHPAFEAWMSMFITPIQIGTTDTPWSLAIVIPRRTVMESTRAMEITALILGLAVVVLVIVAAALLSRSLAKPVATAIDAFRDVAAMRDSLKIGIFLMDRDCAIQDNYSKFLEELLSMEGLKGRRFTDIIEGSVPAAELASIKDYLEMFFSGTVGQDVLREINPLRELPYVPPSGSSKTFDCELLPVEQGEGLVLVTIYDITASVELQKRFQRDGGGKKRHDMRDLFELLQLDPPTFEASWKGMQAQFERTDSIMGDGDLSSRQVLAALCEPVRAIEEAAAGLGLKSFAAKVAEVASQIGGLRERGCEIPFDDMLSLTMSMERLVQEKEEFRMILERIGAFRDEARGDSESVFLENLSRTADKAATEAGKKVRFIVADIDMDALERGPKNVMKEVLLQLVRNSVMHGLEPPEERAAAGKNEAGAIRLSVKRYKDGIHVRLLDDGKGLDFGRIREKALRLGLLTEAEAGDKNRLLGLIFSPGFSTAEDGDGLARGVGLHLVRDQVRGARGTIRLQTEAGKGTAFNIFFPAAGSPPPAAEAS